MIHSIINHPKKNTPEHLIQEQQEKQKFSKIKEQAKLYLQQKDSLQALSGCHNFVFKLQLEEKNVYFKVDRKQDNCASIMEKIVWKASQLLNLENFFTRTTTLTVEKSSSKENQILKTYKKIDLDDEEFDLDFPLVGSLQLEQKGWLLDDYRIKSLSKIFPISRLKIAEALFIAAIFGFSDAHGSNIIITKSGEIKFFDNTRSLCHSNPYIVVGGAEAWHAFRCALFDEPQTAEPLKPKELDALDQLLQKCEENVEKLDKYFKSEKLKRKISKFPWKYFDPNLSIKAFKERLLLLRTALNDKKIKKSEDLLCILNPQYKLWFGLECFQGFYKKNYSTVEYSTLKNYDIHDNVSYHSTKRIKKAIANGLEFSEFWNFLTIPSFEEIVKNAHSLNLKLLCKSINKETEEKNKLNAKKILFLLRNFYEIENRSISRADCRRYHIELIVEKIQFWITLYRDNFFEEPIKEFLFESKTSIPQETFLKILKSHHNKEAFLKEFEPEIVSAILKKRDSPECLESIHKKIFLLKIKKVREEFLSFSKESEKEKERKKFKKTTNKIFNRLDDDLYIQDKLESLLDFLKDR